MGSNRRSRASVCADEWETGNYPREVALSAALDFLANILEKTLSSGDIFFNLAVTAEIARSFVFDDRKAGHAVISRPSLS